MAYAKLSSRIGLSAVAAVFAFMAPAAAAQTFPGLPKVKMPSRGASAAAEPSSVSAVPAQRNRELDREYMQLVDQVLQQVRYNGAHDKDWSAEDAQVAELKALADTLDDPKWQGVSAQQKQMMLQMHGARLKGVERMVDRDIAFANTVSDNRGQAIGAYNSIYSLDAMLYAARKVVPDHAEVASAKAKTEAWLATKGSRDSAAGAGDAVAEAKAKQVRMPPAITRDANIEGLFRRAYATSGIDWQIKAIHIRSGWATKYDAAGRRIGRTRDAAIAAKDPNGNRCNLYDFTMFQDLDGAVRRSSHSTTRIACENIPG